MHAADNLVLRTAIVLCMVAAVVTILYLTPLPNKVITSCERPCHEYHWPMICRVKLVLETHHTVDSSCRNCFSNSSDCSTSCLTTDGNPRGALTINRQLPGPSIQVCQNDILVVDVVNKIPGQSASIHWRGQPQHEAPFMDGVPMVTQCPISSYTTFQYKFRASSPGTHLYHAHSSAETSDGFFGPLIVRQPDRVDPSKKFYDVDEHVILISEWSKSLSTDLLDEKDEANSILINGKAKGGSALTTFLVTKGKRYRFRAAYTGGVSGCPVSLEVENHALKVIALDGNPTSSYEVSSIVLSKGERVDFILKARRKVSDYVLSVKSSCDDKLVGSAIVSYETTKTDLKNAKNKEDDDKDWGNVDRMFDTGICESTMGHVCLGDVRSVKKMPKALRAVNVDKRLYLPFDYRILPGKAKDDSLRKKIYRVNNITFTYPSSPLLTQIGDVSDHLLCNSERKPERCFNEDICECVHVENISLESSVEILLIDQGGDALEHVFHLHGHNFYVVGARKFDQVVSLDQIKDMDDGKKLMRRNLVNAVLKDTIRVPKNGVVAIRFIAKNPGFWMLRDENSDSWTRGLDVVFQVGDSSDFVSAPTNFPSCGSWIGPEYFLA